MDLVGEVLGDSCVGGGIDTERALPSVELTERKFFACNAAKRVSTNCAASVGHGISAGRRHCDAGTNDRGENQLAVRHKAS